MVSLLFLSTLLFTVSGSPDPLIVRSCLPGRAPEKAVSATTYTLSVPPGKTGTVLASLDMPTPPHTTLKIQLESPGKIPPLTLTQTPQTVASGFKEGTHTNLRISYEYTASVKAGVVPPTLRTVFFTILD